MSKTQDIISVRISDDVVLDGKVVREMRYHGHLIGCVISSDAKQPFFKVIFVQYFINFRGKEGPTIGASEINEE